MKNILLLLCCALTVSAKAQTARQYDLAKYYEQGAFLPADSVTVTAPGVLGTVNTIWFKDLTFDEGTIGLDLRGRDVFLRSFLGIAFYGQDDKRYDVLYFRPFNFKSADTARRRWSVAYMSLPDYPWDRLRKEHPLVFENAVTPVPNPNDWFHVTIVVKGDRLKVFVNRNPKPSLDVQLLSLHHTGRFGLFSDGLQSDFAHLTIETQQSKQ